MSKHLDRIADGSRVAIVGGGPASSFFALYLLHYALERAVHPDITIYQQNKFDEPGPRGCKGCAGILSVSLLPNLKELGLTVPEEVIQSKIEHYAVHSPYASITISNPEKEIQVISVYRGGGPRLSHYEANVSFDAWLLREAEKRGAKVEHQTVSGIHLEREEALEVAGKALRYDLIVLASGIQGRPLTVSGIGYIPPRTQVMAQDELYAGVAEVRSHLGSVAHAFLIPHSRLIFGSLVPKGQFINVSILGYGERPVPVTDFLTYDIVREKLPEKYERACGCHPRAVIGSARNYYTDGFVAVGDAVVSRLYKDGIGSSLVTARQAALTAVRYGLSQQDFKRHYEPLCTSIKRDNRWGQLMFYISCRAKDSRTFLLSQQRLIADEQRNARGPQPFTKAAWGMFTGSYSYTSIARMTLHPVSLTNLFLALLKEGSRGLFRGARMGPRRLHVGSRRVLILGSGFGGTYVLRHLVPALNRNENVQTTMVSDENFFLFSPLLHEVAMGRIETRHIAYPIRRLQWRDRFQFIQATVEKIDLGARQVTTTAGSLEYDYLVLALGSITNVSGLSSRGSNVFTLKTLYDSMLIRNHIIRLFERAVTEADIERQKQLLTFIVAGGGYTGVQLVTELRDFICGSLLRTYRTIDPANLRIILVEADPKVVGELHTKLGDYVMRHLRRAGIEVRLSSRVTHVWTDRVEINGKETIPASTVVWTAGVVANPRIAELDVEKDGIGRVLVNEYMEVPALPGVYAVGDCASFKDPKSGQPIPPRAHIAVRQARVVARNILAELRGGDKRPYRYSSNSEMVSLGASSAVFRFRGLRLYGLWARFMWLAGYCLLITGAYNRTRIIMDWLLSVVFGRDTTLLVNLRKSRRPDK